MAYEKTNWIENETPISAKNLNKIEQGIEDAGKTGGILTGSVIGYNGNDIPEGYEEVKMGYSLEETLTGETWIDGKPIYKKVYNCGTLKNNGSVNIPTGLSNVNYIDWEGIALGTGGSMAYPYKMATTGTDYSVKATIYGNSIIVNTTVDLTAYTGYVTILYTKTTD